MAGNEKSEGGWGGNTDGGEEGGWGGGLAFRCSPPPRGGKEDDVEVFCVEVPVRVWNVQVHGLVPHAL